MLISMSGSYRRLPSAWRLLLAFVVLLATTLQVVPRPCGGHEAGGTCPVSAAAQCICSCCTTHVGDPTTPMGDPTTPMGDPTTPMGDPTTPMGDPTTPMGDPQTADGSVYFERMCGTDGKHVLRAIPLAAESPVGHVSLPSWAVPGLWVTPVPTKLSVDLPPAALPPADLGHPHHLTRSFLRPPNA
jgi:hypothetical protein